MFVGIKTIGCLIVGCIVLQDRSNASDNHRGDHNHHPHHQHHKSIQHYVHQRDNQTLKINQQRERLKAKHEERKQKEINMNFSVLNIENPPMSILVGAVLLNVIAQANASIQHPCPPPYDFKGHTHFEGNISNLNLCQSQALGAEVPHFIEGQGQGNQG